MPVDYTPTPAHHATIPVPTDSDTPTLAVFAVPYMDLADECAYQAARVNGAQDAALSRVLPPIFKDSAGSAFDFNFFRVDGASSSTAFWSEQFHLWIKTGINTAGHVYVGDDTYFTDHDTGASGSPPKVDFGCDCSTPASPGRVCLFTTTDPGSTNAPKYILGPASGDYAGTWTTGTLGGTFSSERAARDCCVTPNQTIIVVGGRDGNHSAWRSPDFGLTFFQQDVATESLFTNCLSRVICGKAGLLVAWVKASSVNQGANLYYSTDDGVSWNVRTAIGFDQIQDGVYLPDLDKWFFASGTEIYVTSDPVAGMFTGTDFGTTITALGGMGRSLVFGRDYGGIRAEWHYSGDGLATPPRFIARPTWSSGTLSHVASSPHGQLCLSTFSSLNFTLKV